MKKTTSLLWGAFAFFAFMNAANADDCGSIDVRDNMPAAIKERFMTPSEQGNVGWCFAYAAADLLSQATGDSVSALYTSAAYVNDLNGVERWTRHIFEGKHAIDDGGSIDLSIRQMQKLGRYCPEKSIHSIGYLDLSFAMDGSNYIMRSIGTDSLLQYLDNYRQNKCTGVCAAVLDNLITAYIPLADPAKIKAYALANASINMDQLFFNILDQNCDSMQKFNKEFAVNSFSRGSASHSDMLRLVSDHVDQALEAGSVVGISYHAHYVTAKAPQNIFSDSHASSVVARKKSGDVCYYLVRNSWGSFCDYLPGIICEQAQGAYWVSQQKLNQMTDEMFAIER